MSATPTPSLDRLRHAVAERVRATSLRAVARQVGMSPSGLHSFLSGGVPYQKSRRKLFDWLHRERGGRAGDEVSSALVSLVRDLPAERREPALEALVDTLRSLYDTHADAAPRWLGELTRRTGSALSREDADEDGEEPSPGLVGAAGER